MLKNEFLLFIIIVLFSFNTNAGDRKTYCWNDAGLRYGIDPLLLYAIAERESSLNPAAINNESPSSRAIGLMQIHSFWFPHLKQYGISENDLLSPCTNIMVGAWVLAQQIKIFGNNWEAVGAYYAGTSKKEKYTKIRAKYAKSVCKRYVRITNANSGMCK